MAIFNHLNTRLSTAEPGSKRQKVIHHVQHRNGVKNRDARTHTFWAQVDHSLYLS
jgi:hypothetical protein